ncbi:hypothetical protein EYR36_006279 [Pleurotus pulmonarius]|nr:hypothetical protein EYR36_006279 [Pleurotus pulmonarius]KAF4600984.1 hypothetical protein EYR38_005631 [Pleurotus pulmonarius]
MPYVDLYSSDDYAALWYTTNTPYNNVGGFDPSKPSIMILHPMFLCSKWLDNQFGDFRLDYGYNLIAFDMRVAGKSVCRPSGKHDSWVDAADLAFAARSLHLPPVHVLALESISTLCAMRFALLFPEMCLSLTLSNIPGPLERDKWFTTGLEELLQSWCCASDLESFEHIAKEATRFVAGPSCDDPDLIDDLITYWEIELPPTKSQRIAEQLNILLNRVPLSNAALGRITQPVLVLHAERSESCPRKYADRLAEKLVSVRGGAVVYTVKGVAGSLSIIPGHASIANQAFVKFLARLPKSRSDIRPPDVPLQQRMQQALNTLAELVGDETIRQRNPLSPLSFSGLSPEKVASQSETLAHYGALQKTAFTPLRPDGAPARKYSESRNYHWFQSERNGLSYAGASIPATSRQTKEPEPELLDTRAPLPSLDSPPPPSPPPVQSSSKGNNQPTGKVTELRVRRTTVTMSGPVSVNKLAGVQVPMARVIGSLPIQKSIM